MYVDEVWWVFEVWFWVVEVEGGFGDWVWFYVGKEVVCFSIGNVEYVEWGVCVYVDVVVEYGECILCEGGWGVE